MTQRHSEGSPLNKTHREARTAAQAVRHKQVAPGSLPETNPQQTAVDGLTDLMRLTPLEEGLWRGQSQDLGLPQLYGGQLLGQVLAAAAQGIASERTPHSLHGYFLRGGDPHQGVDYRVSAVRDGNHFSVRHVTAFQQDRPLFEGSVSFHAREPHGLEHTAVMPQVASPEQLLDKDPSRSRRFPGHPSEFIPLPDAPLDQAGNPAGQALWFRAASQLPDGPDLHRCLLAYVCDFNLLITGLIPHGMDFTDPRLRIASLDHALWLHNDTRLDDWLLYVTDSPWADHARTLARGQIFDRQGRLIASAAQEGLTRLQPTNG